MKFDNSLKKTDRIINALAGILLGFLGLLGTGVCLIIFYFVGPELPDLSAKNKNPLIFAVFFLPIGIGCLTIAWRLITGIKRKADGGLLPPSVIFLFGLFFLIVPCFLSP